MDTTFGSHMDALLDVASPSTPPVQAARNASGRTQSARELAERFGSQLQRQLGHQLDKLRPEDVTEGGRLYNDVQRLAVHIGTASGVNIDTAALIAPYAMLHAAADQQRESQRNPSWFDPALPGRRQANDFALWDRQGPLDRIQVGLVPLNGYLPVNQLHHTRKSGWEVALEASAVLQHDPDIDLSDARPADFKQGGKYVDLTNSLADRIGAQYEDLEPDQRRIAAEKACEVTAFVQGSGKLATRCADPVAEGRLAQLDSAIGDQSALDFDVETEAPREFEHEFKRQEPTDLLDSIELDAHFLDALDGLEEDSDRKLGSIGLRVPERTSIGIA